MVRRDEDIARVGIRMEKTDGEHLMKHGGPAVFNE